MGGSYKISLPHSLSLSLSLSLSPSLSQTVKFDSTIGQQYVNQWVRPHFWFLVYADPYTCEASAPPTDEVIQYEVVFLNPDSSGEASDHFGDDLRGRTVLSVLRI